MLYSFGAYCFDPACYALTHLGRPVSLRPQGCELLAYLLTHRDRVVSKEELLAQVWPGQYVGDAVCIRASWRCARRCTIPDARRLCCTPCGGAATGLWHLWKSGTCWHSMTHLRSSVPCATRFRYRRTRHHHRSPCLMLPDLAPTRNTSWSVPSAVSWSICRAWSHNWPRDFTRCCETIIRSAHEVI